MRRWIALAAAVAALALTGTALALTESGRAGGSADVEEAAQEGVTTTTRLAASEKPVETAVSDDDPAPEEQHAISMTDVLPPFVEVLHPADGQVFSSKEVVFEGVTEPGAKVFVRDRLVEGSEDGSWRIVLHLGDGKNLFTFMAKDDAGNHATDTVIVVYRPEEPEQPKEEPRDQPKEEPREEPKEQPKEEPREEPKEEPREQPKEEPKEEHEEEPKEEEHPEWEFTASQLYGECSETPPFDVFHGTGEPLSVIHVVSEFGGGSTEVGEKGGWEIKVIFESAPVGQAFPVKVKDEHGNVKVFEFVRIG